MLNRKQNCKVLNLNERMTQKEKKYRLEQQLLRLRKAYLGDSSESPNAIIEEIFYDTYCQGDGTSDNPTFKIRWDSALAQIVSYSTAKLIRIHHGEKHVDDVMNCLFLWFSNSEQFVQIKEDYILSSLFQFITYNGTKGGNHDINEIFQIEYQYAPKNRNQIEKEIERKGPDATIIRSYPKYFRLHPIDGLPDRSNSEIKAKQELLDPINLLIENETVRDLTDLCDEIECAVKRWMQKNQYDYDAVVKEILSDKKKLEKEVEAAFTRMGSHWPKSLLCREIETIIKQHIDLSRNNELLLGMRRFKTARKLITFSIVIHHKGSWYL